LVKLPWSAELALACAFWLLSAFLLWSQGRTERAEALRGSLQQSVGAVEN
jgi:hypothetical protein